MDISHIFGVLQSFKLFSFALNIKLMILWFDYDANEILKKQCFNISNANCSKQLKEQQRIADENDKQNEQTP